MKSVKIIVYGEISKEEIDIIKVVNYKPFIGFGGQVTNISIKQGQETIRGLGQRNPVAYIEKDKEVTIEMIVEEQIIM